MNIFNQFTVFKVLECPGCEEQYFLSISERNVSIGGMLCKNCGEHLGLSDFEAIVGTLNEAHVCKGEKRKIEETRIEVLLEDEVIVCKDCGQVLELTRFYYEREEFQKDAGIEKVAKKLHQNWMDWSKAIAEEEEISDKRLERWEEECWMPYEQLSEKMKEKDRKRARNLLEDLGVLNH